MNNFYGIDNETIEIFRLTGIGWLYAFFIVGATILAARFLVGWQVRRFERIMARKDAEEAEGEKGPDTRGSPEG